MSPNLSKGGNHIIYPYAERNKEPILEAIFPFLQQASRVLEIASGSGQHVSHWAGSFPSVQFQPSEIEDPRLLASIRSYTQDFPNVALPIILNALNDEHWLQARDLVAAKGPFDMAYFGNLLHISSWDVSLALATNLPALLAEGGALIVYGPFKRDGKFTTESNKEFDRTLRAKNTEWGLRDISDLATEFAKFGLSLKEIRDMPANNFILVFRKDM